MNPLRLFFIALQFLTRLPSPLERLPSEAEIGRSVLCYPLVGLLIGSLLAGMAWLLAAHLPQLPAAALLLAFWIWLYGGLHLDALADSADAWGGSQGHGQNQRERALAIMKDPNCGPFGVAAIVIMLLLKFAALASLLDRPADSRAFDFLPFILAPLLGRTVLLPLFMTTDYVRPQGLGSAMHAHLPRPAAWLLLAALVLLVALGCGQRALAPLLAAAGVFLLSRRLMLRQIGGMTGDTAGALVEAVEAAVLLACLWY